MSDAIRDANVGETPPVEVHYWASARAAAGTNGDSLAVEGEVSLAEVVRRVVALHPDGRLGDVLAVCSVLVGERPAGTLDPESVTVRPGQSVEFLPPFAGG